jgi:hypothetical protein
MAASNDALMHVWDTMVSTQEEKIETRTKGPGRVVRGEVPRVVQAKLDELIGSMKGKGKCHRQKRCTEDPQTCHVWVNKSWHAGDCDICKTWTDPYAEDLRVIAVVGKNQTYDGKSVRYICTLCWPKYVESRDFDICKGEACEVWMRMIDAAYPKTTSTQLATIMKASAVVAPPPPPSPPAYPDCVAMVRRLVDVEGDVASLKNELISLKLELEEVKKSQDSSSSASFCMTEISPGMLP